MFMRNVIKKLLLALLLTAPLAALAANSELTWYGHAAFKSLPHPARFC